VARTCFNLAINAKIVRRLCAAASIATPQQESNAALRKSFWMQGGPKRAKLELVYRLARFAMYLTDDGILVALYALIFFFGSLFAAYAAKEWLSERRANRVNAHLNRTKASTWNAFRGEWVADHDS
jgi:hypothetical protein